VITRRLRVLAIRLPALSGALPPISRHPHASPLQKTACTQSVPPFLAGGFSCITSHYSPVDLASQRVNPCGFGNSRTALQDCSGSPARPPVCTRWPPLRLPSLRNALNRATTRGSTISRLERLRSLGPYMRCSDRSSLFHRVLPSQVQPNMRHEPTTTFRSIEWLISF